MSRSHREMIHISVGSTACEVAAHWQNLQGLAATSDTCEAQVTHSTFQQYYVPRAIFIDRPSAFVRQQQRFWHATEAADSLVWSGTVETVESSRVNQPENDSFLHFFQTAATLAYAPYSRYKAPARYSEEPNKYNSSGRHVNWDEEVDNSVNEEEAARARQRQEKRQQQEWYDSTFQPLQSEMEERSAAFQTHNNQEAKALSDTSVKEDQKQQEPIAWVDYLMPPYDPRSCLPLPQDSTVAAAWDTYQNGLAGINNKWKDDALFEQLRRTLEDCDACQGVLIMTSSSASMAHAPASATPAPYGWASGLTVAMLQELQDECPMAQRMVMSIEENAHREPGHQPDATPSTEEKAVSWNNRNIHKVRGQVERGLAMQQYRELAQMVLPLRLPIQSATSVSRFDQTAWLAASLESVTLPYRLRHNPELSLIGMNSSYYSGSFAGGLSYGTSSSLSFREYLHQLRPSSQHIILELDTLLPSTHLSTSLESLLLSGTGIERDARMRSGHNNFNSSASFELPGMWVQSTSHGGILSSLSPSNIDEDRLLHRHFASFGALRPSLDASRRKKQQPGEPTSLTRYLTCLMEGTGPRFATQQTAASVIQQSLGDLTNGGYGAGSYWQHIWSSRSSSASPRNPTVLALLGNTTRRYHHLELTASELKDGLSSRFRGYYNRDVEQGALPEREDCEDALAACLDLRDAYFPLEGSGLLHNF
ncbi:hypothetical protein FisN_20Lh182 [Fistulifera solaris]|uniref:Misato Segment II tubulin-like domain-containing protein n=1 Tax=Fistulifera solaris TaxID=1519565 RepID=A0A1Z5KSH4_FISSO|nr:hypothetical protein FisN_20Lh182 [Fistulifera solaris]|eukprot:GAX28878.1 hypothetical protein FisN_20Lh182 [Fistulifera solaris]